MPNYLGVLDEISLALTKARSALHEGTLADFMDYYRQELNKIPHLKEVTNEVNEACAIQLSEVLNSLDCYATFESDRYEADDEISFEVVSNLLGSLGVIEIPNEDVAQATLFVKHDILTKKLKRKAMGDLEKYTKHLKEIDQELSEHGLLVQFD